MQNVYTGSAALSGTSSAAILVLRAAVWRLSGIGRPRLPRNVLCAYWVRNSPRAWSNGTTRVRKISKSTGLETRKLNPSAAPSSNQRSISLATVSAVPTKGERRAAKRHWAFDVDGENPPPLLVGDGAGRVEADQAGGVDENVERARAGV